jgi:hypothetical protein
MSFRQMLDHTADIVRPSPALSADPLGDESDVYSVAHATARCAFWPLMAPLTDYGAGETPTGKTMGAFERSVTPQPRDVVVILSGPETPKRWRIVADRSPGRRFGRMAHHREVECEPFEGSLVGYDTPAPAGDS